MRYSDEIRRNRESRPADYGMACAASRYAQRVYPSKPVEGVMADYDLTNGEARGVVYGTASRSTLDKMLKRGGWGLVLELMADVLGHPIENHIQKEAEDARRERAAWEAKEQALERLEARLRARPADRSFMGGPGA